MTDLKTPPTTIPDDETPAREPKAKVEFSGPQLMGGALAASTAAILGSQLGTAGTVLGAGLASVISAVSTTFYSAGLQRTAHGLRLVVDRRRRPLDDEAPDPVREPDPRSAGATQARPARRTVTIAALSVIATAIATFALTMLAVTGLETATGRGLDGGESPTVTRMVPATTASEDPGPSTDTAEPAASASPTPSETPEADVPSPEPTPTGVDEPSATPAPDEPTPTSDPTSTTTQDSTGGSTNAPATTEPAEPGQAG